MAFLKHRDEKEVFAFDFAARLVAGETLSNPAVKVTQRTGSVYADKSAEFVQGSPTVSGTKVQVTLKAAAAANEQVSGPVYTVYAKADTSQGRILVGVTILEVTRKAAT